MPLSTAVAIPLLLAGLSLGQHSRAAPAAGDRSLTYTNPIDLPYRYQVHNPPFREGADPTMIQFKDRYYLFVSHSQGYWSSKDLKNWTFIKPTGFDVYKYAPSAMVKDGKVYLAASEGAPVIWVTSDPEGGQWSVAADIGAGYHDPMLFLDDDGAVYMYDGISGTDPLRVTQLDPGTFQPLKKVAIPASRDEARRGYEVFGDANERVAEQTWIEGGWVNKINGKYYLQYSAPGTELKSYADGMLVADNPLGPFTLSPVSPMSSKPTGFIAGAGHSSTFQGPGGQWWHAATMTISKRHIWERRLGLFPVAVGPDGPVTETYLGDYPRYLTGKRELTGWMLLSRKKPVKTSSALLDFPASNAVDENIRTWWSAESGDAGEWLQIDLGAAKRIEAFQVNFADQDSTGRDISVDVYQYVIKTSVDGKRWDVAVDQSKAGRDAPHDYQVLPKAVTARYVKIENLHSPDRSKFSLSDLRVFGHGGGAKPGVVARQTAVRDPLDARRATFSWAPVKGAEFYIVRYGANPASMNQTFQVYDGATSLKVRNLVQGRAYHYTVDAVNENGISRGASVLKLAATGS
ncbi:family 43 glycosylhydrolase [Roseateles oligotrophus]|uniref:Family 43 glycosylhydrolase n=1 Tax=Roseateles oligotrophus TaxID=1769250 RepID=A0ABT2YJH4_9BURK|nr:family 43 glycosylhydrolase [Roseateles oligotrophus]MCV2370220.1 family 43 glycosylhydrolase [Roseateles oligotrophus]